MAAQTKKCPLCAETIPVEAETCEYCNAKFVVSIDGYCTNCHEMRLADASGRCKVCGTEITDLRVESKFIEEVAPQPAPALLAQPVPTLAQGMQPAPPPARKNLTWLWVTLGVVGALFIVGIIGGVIWALNGFELPASFGPQPTATRSIPTRTPLPSAPPNFTATEQARQNAFATGTAQASQSLLDRYLGWPVVLYDPFYSNTNDWWIVDDFEDDYRKITLSIVDGIYRVSFYAKQTSGDIIYPGSLPDDVAFSDFSLSVDLKESGRPADEGPDRSSIGVFFRWVSDGNYYIFEIGPNGNGGLGIIENGQWIGSIGDFQQIPNYKPFDWNHLQVVGEGNHIMVFLNNVFFIDGYGDRFFSGKVGFNIYVAQAGSYAQFEFDNFELRTP